MGSTGQVRALAVLLPLPAVLRTLPCLPVVALHRARHRRELPRLASHPTRGVTQTRQASALLAHFEPVGHGFRDRLTLYSNLGHFWGEAEEETGEPGHEVVPANRIGLIELTGLVQVP